MQILDRIQATIPKASYFNKDEIDLMIKILEIYRDVLEKTRKEGHPDKILDTIIELLDGFYILQNEQHEIERAKAGLL